jgi:hypothetical protein
MLVRHKTLLALAVLILLGGSFGCAGPSAPATQALAMAPMDQMSPAVQQAPAAVQQAYRFAAANPDLLQHIPCYCGCNKQGHKSNYDCYVAGQDAAGQLTLNPHALGCTICVDITQDAMRLRREGQSTAAIRDFIDTTYAKYGPANRALVE